MAIAANMPDATAGFGGAPGAGENGGLSGFMGLDGDVIST